MGIQPFLLKKTPKKSQEDTTVMGQFIVVEDIQGIHPEGAIIDDIAKHKAVSDGATILPINSYLFRRNGIAGYAKRAWGSGWSFEAIPRPITPITLYAVPEHPNLSWAARIQPTVKGKTKLTGMVRFVCDVSQRKVIQAGLAADSRSKLAVDLGSLGEPDEYGGWVIGGHGVLNVNSEGYYGFALYGNPGSTAVVWVAVSQSAQRSVLCGSCTAFPGAILVRHLTKPSAAMLHRQI